VKLAEHMVASARRYSADVLKQLAPLNLPEGAKADLCRFIHGAYISGMATLANSQIVMDGDEDLDPRAVLKACDEVPALLGESAMKVLGGNGL